MLSAANLSLSRAGGIVPGNLRYAGRTCDYIFFPGDMNVFFTGCSIFSLILTEKNYIHRMQMHEQPVGVIVYAL